MQTITDRMRAELSAYIEKYYVPAADISGASFGSAASERTDAGVEPYISKDSLSDKASKNLEEMLGELGESFHEKLFSLIDAAGLPDTEVYRRAGLDRKLFSKIRSNPAYHPRKGTVLALCIALKLGVDEAADLLSRAGYAFSPGSRADMIVKFFIEHGVYDIDAVNYTLEEYGEGAQLGKYKQGRDI